MWFRLDLRLADNPALIAAAKNGAVLPVYILDDDNAQQWAMGGASRCWLHESLSSLNASLDNKLLVLNGDAQQLIPLLAQRYQVNEIYWNRCYEPWRIARDTRIKADLSAASVNVQTFNGSLLWEPWTVSKADKSPYKVFTPYYRRGCLNAAEPRQPMPAPDNLNLWSPDAGHPHDDLSSLGTAGINSLNLLPEIAWHKEIQTTWKVGESAAQQRLADFLDAGLTGYREGRNFPTKANVSRLSPHLHFGEISPNQAWHQAKMAGAHLQAEDDLDCFLSELGWREFSYNLLYHRPELPTEPIQQKFKNFPWDTNQAAAKAWQKGLTGYPLVDAGMRELWQTGYMHNRVRMVVGSFLVKNLQTHWHIGENWFWDCLVDADLASNSASWQWIAGCGADAAPYFRVFNPTTQSERFDSEGGYIRRYVPELAKLPAKYIHAPAKAPQAILDAAGITLGDNYPLPIVDVKASRERALAAFKSLGSQVRLED